MGDVATESLPDQWQATMVRLQSRHPDLQFSFHRFDFYRALMVTASVIGHGGLMMFLYDDERLDSVVDPVPGQLRRLVHHMFLYDPYGVGGREKRKDGASHGGHDRH
jgi:hypothetical protein